MQALESKEMPPEGEFEACLRRALTARTPAERARCLEQARGFSEEERLAIEQALEIGSHRLY